MASKKLSVFSLAAEIGLDSGVLMLRPKAKDMFDLSLMRSGKPLIGDVFICDFSKIEDCSGSFVDEFVLNWQREIRNVDNSMLILTEMTPDVQYTVLSSLLLRNKMDKDDLVLVAKAGPQYQIFGDKLEKNVIDVFNLMAGGEHITARLIADHFNLELNSAGNRLKKLYDSHATLRIEQRAEDGGKYEYYLP